MKKSGASPLAKAHIDPCAPATRPPAAVVHGSILGFGRRFVVPAKPTDRIRPLQCTFGNAPMEVQHHLRGEPLFAQPAKVLQRPVQVADLPLSSIPWRPAGAQHLPAAANSTVEPARPADATASLSSALAANRPAISGRTMSSGRSRSNSCSISAKLPDAQSKGASAHILSDRIRSPMPTRAEDEVLTRRQVAHCSV